MADSDAAPNTAAESIEDKPATYRLVIRAKIIPEESPSPAPPQWDRRALGLVAGGIAALLAMVWIGVSVFRSDAPPARTASEETQDAAVAPAVAPPAPRASVETKSVESTAASQRDAPPSAINEVIPNASRGALQTIRGTIRVSIRVTIDKQGAVAAATTTEPGPSRYFERLALDASKKWTFTPATNDEPRKILVRFSFTRNGVTARAES